MLSQLTYTDALIRKLRVAHWKILEDDEWRNPLKFRFDFNKKIDFNQKYSVYENQQADISDRDSDGFVKPMSTQKRPSMKNAPKKPKKKLNRKITGKKLNF